MPVTIDVGVRFAELSQVLATVLLASAIGLSLLLLPVLEQSAPTCHVRTFYGWFPRSPQGLSLFGHSFP